MPERTLSAAWAAVPEPARRRLAVASTGWRHLARAGSEVLAAARAAAGAESVRLRALAADIVLWAFGENPLHGPLAAEILSAGGELPLPALARRTLAAVAAGWREPGPREAGAALFRRLAERRDDARLADFLAERIADESGGLFWREKALALALSLGGEMPEARARLETAALANLAGDLAPAAGALRGQAAFLRGDARACLAEQRNLPPVFGPALPAARSGLALLAAGEEEAALPHLFAAIAAAPWQAGLACVLADVLSGGRRALDPPAGPVLVMLYTWNKAADLAETLASLAASELCGARILVLDNGSSDDTPRVLEDGGNRLGGILSRLTLPTNIGAPAARNWLAATPEARGARSLVYLDDDVTLPRDWLLRLGAAQRRFPEAGVVGCSVADRRAPRLLQNVAGQLVVPDEAPADRPDLDFRSLAPNPFRLADAHLQGPDWGLFSGTTPCTSVTGCCHMFRRAALDAPFAEGGGFSLALGPSQYDDFERDLRMAAAGGFAAHAGNLVARHAKRSGVAARSGRAAANALGNRYKMQAVHPRAEIAGIIRKQNERLAAHVASALRRIAEDAPSHRGDRI